MRSSASPAIPGKIETAVRGKGTWHSYVELHIEQGGTLDQAKVPIGIVEGIVGDSPLRRGHRGLREPRRHDADGRAQGRDGGGVAVDAGGPRDRGARGRAGRSARLGGIEVEPNSPNVIPGKVTMSVEFRDLSEAVLRELGDAAKARGAAIAKDTGTTITFTLASTKSGAPATKRRAGRHRQCRERAQPADDAPAERRRSRRAADCARCAPWG